jgi:hypothetical protein
MSTWRVPAELKAQIEALVPHRYPNTTAAQLDLCRRGLAEVAREGPERSVFGEHFLMEAQRVISSHSVDDRPRWHVDWSQPGIPLVPLNIHSLVFRRDGGDEITDQMHLVQVVTGGSPDLLKSGMPLSWVTDNTGTSELYGHPFLHHPVFRAPNIIFIEGSVEMSVLAGTFLVEVSRCDGRTPVYQPGPGLVPPFGALQPAGGSSHLGVDPRRAYPHGAW